jgi:hypothetical protein
MIGLAVFLGGCSSGQTFFVKDSLVKTSAGDEIATMAEMHESTCHFKKVHTVVRTETTWNRGDEPTRVLTVEGDLKAAGVLRGAVETRLVDADHVVLARDGEPVAAFDYDHARAYFGPAAQPAWAKRGQAVAR